MSRPVAVVILIILAAGVFWGMWRSWIQQTHREQDKINPLPKAPQKLGAHLRSYPEIIYVSTVFHGKYLERVHAYKLGVRTKAKVDAYQNALVITAPNGLALNLEWANLTEVYFSSGMIGKFVGKDRLLNLSWTHQNQGEKLTLVTGIYVPDETQRSDFYQEISTKINNAKNPAEKQITPKEMQ